MAFKVTHEFESEVADEVGNDDEVKPSDWNKEHVVEGSLTNLLEDVLGVASLWDTDPSNLINATDGEPSNPTGTGLNTVGEAGTYGRVTFDLGSEKTVLIRAKVGVSASSGTVSLYVDPSDDGSIFDNTKNGLIGSVSGTSEVVVRQNLAVILTARYISLRFNASGAADCTGKIYEISAYDLGDF